MGRRPTASCPRPAALAAGLALLASCAARPAPVDPGTPVIEGLRSLGTVVASRGGVPPRVVVVRDRHHVHGGLTRVRGPLRDLQRENSLAIRFLLAKGYDLLGCEAALGPLPRSPLAERHRRAVRDALEQSDDLDALTVYQPVRYEIELAGRMRVVGVEDPGLYASDVAALEDLIRIRGVLARADVSEDDRAALAAEERELLLAIRRHTDRRGRTAAANLVRLMRRDGHGRAVLLVGGAHTRGAGEALEALGVPFAVFEARSYARRDR